VTATGGQIWTDRFNYSRYAQEMRAFNERQEQGEQALRSLEVIYGVPVREAVELFDDFTPQEQAQFAVKMMEVYENGLTRAEQRRFDEVPVRANRSNVARVGLNKKFVNIGLGASRRDITTT